MKNNYKSGRIITFIFFFLIGIGSVFATIDRIDFMKNSIVTEGTVTNIIVKSTSKTDRVFIFVTRKIEISVISYKGTDGKTYRIEETPFFSSAPFKMGEKVKVRYEKDSEANGIVNSYTNIFGYIILLYFICVIFFLVFLFLNSEIKKEASMQRNEHYKKIP